MPEQPTMTIDEYGDKVWTLNGKIHREDGPAIERSDGSKEWCLNGDLHCEDGPAIEYPNGSKFWYLNGLLHREDGPAIEWAVGTKEWWVNGKQVDEFVFWLTTKERMKDKQNV